MKNTRRNNAVSEIIGTLLLLGITVSLFSVVSLSVFSIQPPTPAPTVNIVCTAEGNNLILDHYGGEPLGLDTKVFLTVCNQSLVQTTAGELLDEKGKADGVWNIGERLVYSFDYDEDYPNAEAQVVDAKTNSMVMDAIITIPPTCDIEVKMVADKDFPDIHSNVVFTITAKNLGGNIAATHVQIKDKLPNELTCISDTPTKGTYDPSTGIWTIDTLNTSESCTLQITAGINEVGTTTGFTQLAMLLDGSGSIQPADWTTMLEGVATAVEDPRCFSQDGSVELTVIQFAGFTSQLHFGISDTTLEAGPIVINQTNNHTVASAIRSISQKGGPTPTAMGIYLAADILSNDTNGYLQGTSWQGLGSRHFNPGNRQIIDVITDGAPTICMEKGRYDHIWNCYSDCLGYTCSQQSAESALAYLRNTLQMDDNDEFNVQAINTAPYYIDIPWLKNNLTFPQPGHYAPSFTPGGWVYNVSTYQELCVSIHKQFALLFHSITNTAVLQPSYAWFVDPNSRNNAARVDIAPMN